jgi:hypothetical protein
MENLADVTPANKLCTVDKLASEDENETVKSATRSDQALPSTMAGCKVRAALSAIALQYSPMASSSWQVFNEKKRRQIAMFRKLRSFHFP